MCAIGSRSTAPRDISTEELIRTHSNAGDNSGGEQEKLMAFCLAGALSFNLASPESADNRPVFAQLMLDEAFSKSDPQFAQQAAAGVPQVRLPAGDRRDGAERHHHPALHRQRGDGVQDRTHRPQRPPVASVATRTISEFTSLRQGLRASAERVPAAV
jgi:Putative exonuclease SbcCD, C subunit